MIGIIGALDAEIQEYLNHLENRKEVSWNHATFYEGTLAGQSVVVVQSGVGKVMAAMTTQRLLDVYEPTSILFTGVAGALNSQYEVGDVVVAKDCVQHDLDTIVLGFSRGTIPYTEHRFFKTDETLRKHALSVQDLGTFPHPIYEGRIVTGDQFMTRQGLQDKEYLTGELAGDAVEMEGAAVGAVCFLNQVPFLILRTISDKADEEASVDYNTFFPEVAKNSFLMVRHVLERV